MRDTRLFLCWSFLFPILLEFGLAGAPSALAQDKPAAEEEDKTGTDPTKLLKTVIVYNEFRSLGDGQFYNESMYRFILPHKAMKYQFSFPIDSTDASGAVQAGFGDVAFKATWRPVLTPRYGLLFSLDSAWPTATGDSFGSGKYVVTPGVTYALFVGDRILAPSVQQKISYADNGDDRSDIQQTQVDLYFVWKPVRTTWYIVDPQFLYDWDAGRLITQLEIEWGRVVGAGISSYIRPGMSFGSQKPFEWNLEAGIKFIN